MLAGAEEFPSWWTEESVLLMIDMFFDESGNAKKHLLVVSAYLGPTGDMRKLTRKWKTHLKDYGVEYFHAKDYRKRHSGVFKHLSRTKRKELLDKLLKLIERYAEAGITARINTDEYKRLTTPVFRSQWGAPYPFCVQLILLRLALILHEDKRSGRKPDHPVNVLIEDGHTNAQQALDMLNRQHSAIRIVSRGFGKKKDHPLFQAADLLAYSSSDHSSTPDESYLFERLRSARKPTYYMITCDAGIIEIAKSAVPITQAESEKHYESSGLRAAGTAPRKPKRLHCKPAPRDTEKPLRRRQIGAALVGQKNTSRFPWRKVQASQESPSLDSLLSLHLSVHIRNKGCSA